jgi:amidase
LTVDLAHMDAMDQAHLVQLGQVKPLELIDAAIERIETLNPELNAVVHPLFDQARKRAVGDLPDGPFRGVPIVAKDSLPIAGAPRHLGMRFLQTVGLVDSTDSLLTQHYLSAGFVFVGKTNMPELGILPTTEPLLYEATRNPWNTERSSGGSSGGSAAAVASGMVPVAHAADGAGSIRIPSSECGVFGLKPSLFRVASTSPVPDPTGFNVDHVITRTVRDSAAILDATMDTSVLPLPARPWSDEARTDPGKLRIGWFASPPGASTYVHDECAAATEEAAALLEELGHSVEEYKPAGIWDPQTIQRFVTVWNAGVGAALSSLSTMFPGLTISPGDVEPLTQAMSMSAAQLEQSQPGAAFNALAWLQQQVRLVFLDWWNSENLDLLLSPTIPEPPPPLGDFPQPPSNPMFALFRATQVAPFTALYNLTGQPAASIPFSWSERLPIGVMLAARYAREDVLLQASGQLERARPWTDQRPAISA